MLPRLLAAASFVACVAAIASARAQQGEPALDRFTPSLPADRFFGVPSPEAEGHLRVRASLVAEYQRDPLVLYRVEDGSPGERAGTVVSDQLRFHALAALTLWQRFALAVDLPLVLLNGGDALADVPEPSGAALGDVRLALRGRALGIGPLQVAAGADVWLPTGDTSAYSGAASVRGAPSLVLGGRAGRWFYSFETAVRFAPATVVARTELGDELRFGAGVGRLFLVERLGLGLEAYSGFGLEGRDAFEGRTTNVEVLAGAKYRVGPVVLGAALGPGLSRGVGTPAVRGVLSAAWLPLPVDTDRDRIVDDDDACPTVPGNWRPDPKTSGCPEPPPPDTDRDGIPDPMDACPTVPGLFTGGPGSGCPDSDGDGVVDPADACPTQAGPQTNDPRTSGCVPDRDHDGIPDPKDACPDAPGIESTDKRRRGCPADRDRDGVPDANDACPDRRGPPSSDPTATGCPGDSDGDSLRDDEDACPREAGLPSNDARKRGCPKAFLRAGRIETHGTIEFDDKTQNLAPAGIEALEAVAALLRAKPPAEGIAVDVFTDDQGKRPALVDRSQRRADAVKRWLRKQKGLEKLKVDAKGHGPDKPIADNATEEGRARNRRVEIRVLPATKEVPRIPLPKGPLQVPPPPQPPTQTPAPKGGEPAPAPQPPAPAPPPPTAP